VNTGSMQEMAEEWVDYWMKMLDKLSVRYFYSLNYFGQRLECLEEAGNVWSPRLSSKWKTRVNRVTPFLVSMQTVRPYAEILAEKVDSLSSLDEARSRYAFLKEQYLDSQSLLDCMDVVRVSDDSEIIYDLIVRIEKEMSYIPKELFYLVNRLVKKKVRLKETQQNHVEKLLLQLENSYKTTHKNWEM